MMPPRVTAIRAASLALVAAIAGSARAQTPAPGPAAAPPPPSPQAVAVAHGYADDMIAQASAEDLFENVTTTGLPLVRHRLSGLACSFNKMPGERITVIPSGAPRGDDVGCTSQWRDFTTSL